MRIPRRGRKIRAIQIARRHERCTDTDLAPRKRDISGHIFSAVNQNQIGLLSDQSCLPAKCPGNCPDFGSSIVFGDITVAKDVVQPFHDLGNRARTAAIQHLDAIPETCVELLLQGLD